MCLFFPSELYPVRVYVQFTSEFQTGLAGNKEETCILGKWAQGLDMDIRWAEDPC